VADPTPTQPPAAPSPPQPPPAPAARKPLPPASRRPPTTAEAFFGTGFGCLGTLLFRLGVIAIVVLVADWRAREKYAKRETERAATSETVAKVADEVAKDTDSDGRFVRKPDGPLPETDVWGRQLRLAYKPGVLSDGLEVRSAGPDGVWNTWDDVTVTRSSRISNKALARDAATGLLDAARDKLLGKKPKDGEKK
jgi:hypothetical protein